MTLYAKMLFVCGVSYTTVLSEGFNASLGNTYAGQMFEKTKLEQLPSGRRTVFVHTGLENTVRLKNYSLTD